MSILSDEITNDPLVRGYAGMTDAQVAASLNTADRTVNRRVPVSDLIKYLGSIGKLADFIEAKTDNNAGKRQPVLAVFSLFENPHVTDIDISVEPFQTGLTALVAASLITQPEADGITAMGSETVSRAKELGISVNEGDVRQARAV